MAPAPGVDIPLRYLRTLFKKGATAIRNRLCAEKTTNTRNSLSEAQVRYEPAYARVGQRHTAQQRIKLARRWYTTHFTEYLNSAGATTTRAGFEAGSRYPTSKIGSAISRLTATSPFAHTLRPKLTGGALPRTASGYSLGNGGINGARYFSHSSPTASAQVIAQVSAAVRAFLLQGKDEMESIMKQRNVDIKREVWTNLKEKSRQTEFTAPKGACVDFNIAPTITCLSPLGKKSPSTVSLETPGFMEELSMNFAVMVNDLSVILSDIQKLKFELGDLPIALVTDPKTTKIALRIYFPNHDPSYVETLCKEVGISRGIVGNLEDEEDSPRAKDKAWGEAFELLMPTLILPNKNPASNCWEGPTTVYNSGEIHWNDMLSRCVSPDNSLQSEFSDVESSNADDNGDGDDNGDIFEGESVDVAHDSYSSGSNSVIEHRNELRDYDGLQGIHQFLAECEKYSASRNPWRG